MATRTITGTAGKINVNNGGGLAGNPTLDLATTTVVDGDYNTESLHQYLVLVVIANLLELKL